MRFATRLKPSSHLIDLTPLVDVIFLLLIFFIITSHILPLKSLHIEKPQIGLASEALTSQLPIFVDSEEVIYAGSKKTILELDRLDQFLVKEIDKYKLNHSGKIPTIVLNVDKTVPYDTFLKVLAKSQTVNVPIRLAYSEMD